MGSKVDEPYILVICPRCHTRMHARREHAGRRVACPDCQTQTVIPQPAVATPVKARQVDDYTLRDDAKRSAGEQQPAPKLVLVKCRLCGTRMHVRASQTGKRVRCPDCETPNLVPEYQEPAAPRNADLVVGNYDVGEVAPKPVFARAVQVDVEPHRATPPLPRWVLFSGVYGFPWRAEVVTRWLYITFGLLVLGGILSLVWMLVGGGADNASVVGAGGFLLSAFFIAVWTFSYAASCAGAIVQETAEGADDVSEWPSLDWREWFYPLLTMLYIGGLAVGIGWGARSAALLAGADMPVVWMAFTAGVFFSFPVVWLSALASDSPWAPLSGPVLMSLLRLAGAWLLFYLQTGFWLALLCGVAIGLSRIPVALTLVVAPLLAAYLLIYARLLGRLGWLILDRLGAADDSAAADD